jgi:alkanesulfonate monooxygenase SsuD/methylene tetrahydromethanopterin reductase-like flavin-dependent oxidoreductase (luciferase family)
MLKMHCSKIGRNPDEIRKSLSGLVIIGRSKEEASKSVRSVLKDFSQRRNLKEKILLGIKHPKLALSYLAPFGSAENISTSMIASTPQSCVERLKNYLDLGVTHFHFQFPTSYHGDMESLRLFAEEIPELRRE